MTYEDQYEHVLLTTPPPPPLNFAFAYEPVNCNVDQYYKVLIDNQEADPAWLTIDPAVNPPTAQINLDDAAYEGVYSVSIYTYLNTIPATVSSDQVRFAVSLSLEVCSTLQFDSQEIGPIKFTIGGLPNPAMETFDDFTNSVPADRCGDREYFVF